MISCQIYDYIEIACMYRFEVRLTLQNDEVVTGIACDTCRNASGDECIEIRVGETKALVVLDRLIRMDALTQNPHFEYVVF